MVLVDIYADEGITGTCVNKRDEFLRMIKDCKIGKIDKIFVKSVSRFARNSLECIENIRILKGCNVTVIFENDGIDTESMNSEMILYIKSAFAQSEALAGSKRVTNVRKMFKEYVSGSTLKVIADGLTAKGVVYYEDKRTWNKNMVSRIHENENYLGNEKYPAIIDKNVFDAAMAKRNILGGKREADSDEIKFYKTHTFCAQCGKSYRRVSKFGTREKWFCSNDCKYIHYIDDKWLFGAVVNAINTLILNNDLIVFESKSSDVEFDVQAIRKINEVKHMISQNGSQFAPVKQTLFDCVSAKFDCCALDKEVLFWNR